MMLSVPLRPPADLTGNSNAHGGFRFHLDVQQDASRNAWNTLKDMRSHDASVDYPHALNERNPKKYIPGVLCKSETIQPASSCGLWPTSEQNQTWSKEPQAHHKPTLRSMVSPLNTHRLKPIRQRTKNAVVGICSSNGNNLNTVSIASKSPGHPEALGLFSFYNTLIYINLC